MVVGAYAKGKTSLLEQLAKWGTCPKERTVSYIMVDNLFNISDAKQSFFELQNLDHFLSARGFHKPFAPLTTLKLHNKESIDAKVATEEIMSHGWKIQPLCFFSGGFYCFTAHDNYFYTLLK